MQARSAWRAGGGAEVVYLAGGVHDGEPARDVWRFTLGTFEWVRLAGPPGPEPLPGDVLALTYDDQRGRLLLVDEVAGGAPGNGKAVAKTVARFVLVDPATGASSLCLALPRVGAFTRLGLVAVDDGSFILAGAHGDEHAWKAYSFVLGPLGEVAWTGMASGPGKMLDQPFQTSIGVLMPVEHQGDHHMVTLHPNVFKHDKSGCSAL